MWIVSCILAASLVASPAARPPGAEEPGRREYAEAVKRLDGAARDGKPTAYRAALRVVLRKNDAKAVRAALGSYPRILSNAFRGEHANEGFQTFHGQVAGAYAGVAGERALKELRRQRRKSPDWQARLLLVDAAVFNERLDLEKSCLEALEDDSPVVVRRALGYLRQSRRVPVVEKIVERFVELAKSKRRSTDEEWQRTLLTFESTLQQMLRVDLRSAADWKNYVDVYKQKDDFFEPEERGSKTGLTIFGAAVTGKNIVFILDVSGSMVATDPPPEGSKKQKKKRRTSLAGRGQSQKDGKVVVPEMEERRRLHRAKNELSRVIRQLPEDVRFNVIAYSSAVRPWNTERVPASDEKRSEAIKFVDELRAEGITVTDEALEVAFRDLGIDTIYLITDGAPTHVGLSGPGRPEDADELIKYIHGRVRQVNFLRDVRIFTLGFQGAEEEFLRRLSADNGGRYVRIE